MRARPGDRIVVDTAHLDAERRSGEVLDVLGEGDTRHYRVRWQDGHESIYFPGPDARLIRTD
jgi:translation initiation factor IF-1